MVSRRFVWLAAALLAVACAGPQVRRTAPERFRAHAAAAEAGLLHYPAAGPHVLVVGAPGLSPALFDVPGFGGLAPYLQHEGFDVWVIDWRDAPLTAGLAELGALAHGMAAEINADHRGLSLVAHSLGGVAWLAHDGAPPVDRYVFLAVPGSLRAPLDPVADFAKASWSGPHSLREAATLYEGVKTDRLLLTDLLWSYGAAPLDPARYERLYQPVGEPLLNELTAAIRAEAWPAQVTASLAALRSPVRVFVGQTDGLAPTWQTFETYRRAGSPDKHYRFVGRANGDHREYGHLSLLAGEGAAREVFPLVGAALEN